MSTVYVPLTKGQFALVDEDDYEAVVTLGRWCYSKSGYAVHYYRDAQGGKHMLYMHRLVMTLTLGGPIPDGLQVDHISGAEMGKEARLDNRRENLRLATRSQNQAHKGIPRNNTSAYKGVNWCRGRWEARIKFGAKRIHLGRYDDPMTAATIYDAASKLLYQDFAGCNFPDLPSSDGIMAKLLQRLARAGVDVSQLMMHVSFPK